MTTQQRRRLTSIGLFAVGVFAGLVLAMQHFGDLRLPLWARIVIVTVVVGGSMAFTWKWWSLLDEVAREAHKFAWYWGGSAGMAVAGVVMILVDSGRITAPLFHGPTPADGFTSGVLTVMVAQLIGYTVAWVGWWWSRR